VPGSATLIGGEPGIGKSTLLIQACAALARRGGRVIYVSGEESTEQVRLRAARSPRRRAGATGAQTLIEDIVATLARATRPIRHRRFDPDDVERGDRILAGTVSQVRGASQALIRFANRAAPGHPRRPCHQGRADRRPARRRAHGRRSMSFEGEARTRFAAPRLEEPLRRDDEIGVFEMTGLGLAEVANPSALFSPAATAPRRGCGIRGVEARVPCW